MNLSDELVAEAAYWVGVAEQAGRPNGGPNVEEFQRAVDGRAAGEAWCAAFVCFCIKAVEARLGVSSPLKLSEHVLTMWNSSPTLQRDFPWPGFLMVWQHGTSSSGHIGIVEALCANDPSVLTIEGNTGPDDTSVVREGDGVWRKVRPLRSLGNMKLLGFLSPWG